jgi:hypothetical protein
MHDINHIQNIELMGTSPEPLQNNWMMALSELKREPDPEILQHCYFKQVPWLKPLAEDIAHYERARFLDDKSDYSFQYLFAATDRYILMKRDDAMPESLSRSLMGSPDRAAPGADSKLKGKGKGDQPEGERPERATPGGGNACGGKGTPKGKYACFASQTSTCTRGKDCGHAHIQEHSASEGPEKDLARNNV